MTVFVLMPQWLSFDLMLLFLVLQRMTITIMRMRSPCQLVQPGNLPYPQVQPGGQTSQPPWTPGGPDQPTLPSTSSSASPCWPQRGPGSWNFNQRKVSRRRSLMNLDLLRSTSLHHHKSMLEHFLLQSVKIFHCFLLLIKSKSQMMRRMMRNEELLWLISLKFKPVIFDYLSWWLNLTIYWIFHYNLVYLVQWRIQIQRFLLM